MSDMFLICPECKRKLKSGSGFLCCENNHQFNLKNNIYNLLPSSMTELTKSDALYHENLIGDWENQAQIDAFRNRYFHERVTDFISKRADSESNILELAGGAGYDLKLFMSLEPKFANYIFSEVSENMVRYVSNNVEDGRVRFFSIDAHNIPFADNQFDFVYTLAAFHHFHCMDKALKEIIRVTKKNGFIIFGIEPNRFWFNLISKVKSPVRKILPKKGHSSADDESEGFFIEDLRHIAKDYNLKLLRIEPVWFFVVLYIIYLIFCISYSDLKREFSCRYG